MFWIVSDSEPGAEFFAPTMASVIVIGVREEPGLEHGFFVIRLGDAERFELDLVIVAGVARFEPICTIGDDETGAIGDRGGFRFVADGLGNGVVVHGEFLSPRQGWLWVVEQETN